MSELKFKCEKCGYSWNGRKTRVSKKRQCPNCWSRNISALDVSKKEGIIPAEESQYGSFDTKPIVERRQELRDYDYAKGVCPWCGTPMSKGTMCFNKYRNDDRQPGIYICIRCDHEVGFLV